MPGAGCKQILRCADEAFEESKNDCKYTKIGRLQTKNCNQINCGDQSLANGMEQNVFVKEQH